jgi:hypothetical protein
MFREYTTWRCTALVWVHSGLPCQVDMSIFMILPERVNFVWIWIYVWCVSNADRLILNVPGTIMGMEYFHRLQGIYIYIYIHTHTHTHTHTYTYAYITIQKHMSIILKSCSEYFSFPYTHHWSQWLHSLRHEMSSLAWTLDSNPAQGMDVFPAFILCLCVGSGLATGWSLVQGVLLTL